MLPKTHDVYSCFRRELSSIIANAKSKTIKNNLKGQHKMIAGFYLKESKCHYVTVEDSSIDGSELKQKFEPSPRMLAENLDKLKCSKSAKKFANSKAQNPLLCSNNTSHFLSSRKKKFISNRCEQTFHKERILDYKIHHFSFQDVKVKRLPSSLIETKNHTANHNRQLSSKRVETDKGVKTFPPIRIEKRRETRSSGNDIDRFYIPIDNVLKFKTSERHVQFKQFTLSDDFENSELEKPPRKSVSSITMRRPKQKVSKHSKFEDLISSKQNGDDHQTKETVKLPEISDGAKSLKRNSRVAETGSKKNSTGFDALLTTALNKSFSEHNFGSNSGSFQDDSTHERIQAEHSCDSRTKRIMSLNSVSELDTSCKNKNRALSNTIISTHRADRNERRNDKTDDLSENSSARKTKPTSTMKRCSVDSANQKPHNSSDSANPKQRSNVDSANQKPRYSLGSANQKSHHLTDSTNQQSRISVDSVNQKSRNSVDSANQKSRNSVDSANQKSRNSVDSANQKSRNSVDSANQKSRNSVDSANRKLPLSVDLGNRESTELVAPRTDEHSDRVDASEVSSVKSLTVNGNTRATTPGPLLDCDAMFPPF